MADLSLIQSEYLVDEPGCIDREDNFHDDDSHGIGADEAMPPLQRVEKYAKSDQPFDRQMVPRVMQAAFRSSPPDQLTKDLPHLMQIISTISDEDELTVRSDLLEQIPNLAETGLECAARCPALATLVADHLLPLVVRHLTTAEYHVLKVAQRALLALMERALVTRVQAEIQVCPTILSLSRREQENEYAMDFQTGAVTLMSKMAPLLGRDVMERVFLERFADLCANATFGIRKVCAAHLSDFAAVVGKEAYENVLLPSYVSLCADENWCVRKACAEAAIGVSCACPAAARRTTLAPLFVRLLRDNSRWVRSAAFQTLGPFISTFAEPGVTTLGYNGAGELVLMNKYGCEFEVHSVTPAIEDMKHFVNLAATSDENEIDYGDVFHIPPGQRYYTALSRFHTALSLRAGGVGGGNGGSAAAGLSDEPDSDSDDGQPAFDIDEQLSTLCVYNRAAKLERKERTAEEWSSSLMACISKDDQPKDNNTNTANSNSTTTPHSLMHRSLFPNIETVPQDQLSNHIKSILTNSGLLNPPTLIQHNISLQSGGDRGGGGGRGGLTPREDGDRAKIILFKGDSIAEQEQRQQQQRPLNASLTRSSNSSSDCSDNLEMFNSYYYWYVSPDMPLDPDIVDAGRPLDSLVALPVQLQQTHAPVVVGLGVGVAPDVVPQCEPKPSPSLNNLNEDVPSSSTNSSSLLLNDFSGGNNICDLLSSTLNVVNTDNIDTPTTTNTATTNETFTTTSTVANDDEGYEKDAEDEEEDEDEEDEPAQRIVPQMLINHFTSMTHKQLEENTNADIAYYCAYSLPAVALTLGSENWHLLQGTVEALAQHKYYKVRLTVASCLHELAVILGQEIASEYLTIIFDGFIKDLDEVRIGILKHMAHFLVLITPAKRRHYLGLFVEFLRIDNQRNWRFQLQLAVQLRLAVPLYRPMDVLRHIFSIGIVLLHHGVAVARRTAIMLVTEVFKYCNKKKKTTSNLLVKVAETLAHSTLWKLRQTFALLAAELARQEALAPAVFGAEVLPHLLDLSWDPVAVVRLAVGRTIATHIVTREYFKDPANQHLDSLQTALRRLQADKDKDVRDFSAVKESP